MKTRNAMEYSNAMNIADIFTFFVVPSLLGVVAMWATLRGTT